MRTIIKCPYYYFTLGLSKEMCEGIIQAGINLSSTDAKVNAGTEAREDNYLRQGKVSWFDENHIVSSVINTFVHRGNYAAKWHFTLESS